MSKQVVDNNYIVGEILYLNFNQDLSRLCVGTDIGFTVLDTNPVKLKINRTFNSGVSAVEAMFKSNILALVGGGKQPFKAPNKCIIWDDKGAEIVSEIEYREPVRGVKLTKEVLAVATDDLVRIYDLQDNLKLLHKIQTGINPLGIMELSTTEPLILTPSKESGYVTISNYMSATKKEVAHVKCCKHDIRSIRFNGDSSQFAVIGKLGTIIRIFDTKTQEEVKQFRRGTENADIQSLYFSDDSKFLMVSSNKGTIHLCSIVDEYTNKQSVLSPVSFVLPSYFSSTWAMNKIQLSKEHDKFVAGITKRKDSEEDVYDISVFTYDGKCHIYEFKPKLNLVELKKEEDFIKTE